MKVEQMTRANLRVDGARLWDALMEMAAIGATPKGGVKRLALTDLDRQSRDLFAQWCKAAGLSLTIDAMGNMFARRAGADDNLAPVVIGSHLDTQPTGGKFDGALGVIGALEAVRTLNDLNIATRRPIEVLIVDDSVVARAVMARAIDGAGEFRIREGRCAVADAGGHSCRCEHGGNGPAAQP